MKYFVLQMESCSCFALDTVFGFLQKCDQSCAAFLGGSEVNGCLYFWKHGARCEVTFFHVFLCFFNCQILKPLFVWFAEVDGNLFNSCENDEEICIQFLSQKTACEVFVDNCAGAL